MKGIDVSVWNGVIDWVKVKKEVEFVYIKSSTGVGSDDKNLAANHKGAKAAGLKVGLYHFSTINNIGNPVEDAKAEAQWFLSNLKKYPCDLPAALDLEDSKQHDAEVAAVKSKVTDKKEQEKQIKAITERYRKCIEVYVDAWMDEFEKAGKELVLYSYAPYLNTFLPLGVNLKLWLAGYTRTPILPKAWKDYWCWQYSATGKVSGIATNVDMNIMKP